MRPEDLKKYAAPVPRYTSYPTAPHFSNRVGADQYVQWLGEIPAGSRISLYAHVPFCDTLCWYCGCNTKITQKYEPVARYLAALETEIGNVAGKVAASLRVAHIHWGGGSPSVLTPDHIVELADKLRSSFHFEKDAEFAVEVDPRGLGSDRIAAFGKAGVNRVSIGVQDFDPKVQAAINRTQSFETTGRVITEFRAAGVASINVDLVYGLPHQTSDSVAATIDQVISLRPDRIALFGYAHLPARIVHQRLIDETVLPGSEDRFHQANRAATHLVNAGYVRVGLDHFALPHDELASGRVRRNFQGYTSDGAETLIGLGSSSIGRLPHGYVQNSTPIGEYERRVGEQGFATARGHAMTTDDEARGFVIERLMCDFAFPADELKQRFGKVADPILAQAAKLVEDDREALTEAHPDGFRVTEKGRLFVRTLCAAFDAYLGAKEVRHSAGV